MNYGLYELEGLAEAKDTRPWCWGQVGSSTPFRGPFVSRELAVDDAESELDKGESFTLGRCNMIRPEEYIQDDLDENLYSMNEFLHDEACEFDNDVFSVKEEEKELAQDSLSRHLKAWARMWVSAGDAFLVSDEEEVTLGG